MSNFEPEQEPSAEGDVDESPVSPIESSTGSVADSNESRISATGSCGSTPGPSKLQTEEKAASCGKKRKTKAERLKQSCMTLLIK